MKWENVLKSPWRTIFINRTKRKKIKSGQWIHIKNRNRKIKFQSLYLEEPWIIESLAKVGVTIHKPPLSKTKIRHIHEIKHCHTTKQECGPTEGKIHDTYFMLPKQTINQQIIFIGKNQDVSRPKRARISTHDTGYCDYIKQTPNFI